MVFARFEFVDDGLFSAPRNGAPCGPFRSSLIQDSIAGENRAGGLVDNATGKLTNLAGGLTDGKRDCLAANLTRNGYAKHAATSQPGSARLESKSMYISVPENVDLELP